MENVIYIIDRKGIGPLLGYTEAKYKKLESVLTRSGYRHATVDEIKKFKSIEELPTDTVTNEPAETKKQKNKAIKAENDTPETSIPVDKTVDDEQPESNQ